MLLNTRLEVAERNLRQTQEEREKLMAQRSRLEGDITLLKVSLVLSFQLFVLAKLAFSQFN